MARDYSADFWNTFVGDHTTDQDGPRNGPAQDEPEEDAATFEELRRNLLSQMESPRFSGRLKAQIRSSLVLQLTPNEILTAKPPGQQPDPVRELAHAIVAQHLACSGCDFSLSVFLPESGLNRELHPMSLPNLLAYLRVKYAEFRADERSLLSFLVGHLPVAEDAISASFFNVFTRVNGESDRFSRAIQTDLTEREQDVLDLQLQLQEVKARLGLKTGERFVVEDVFQRFKSDIASEVRRSAMDETMRNKQAEIRHAVEEEAHRHSRELLSVTANWEAKMQDQETKLGIFQQRLQIAEQKAFVERQGLLQQQETTAQLESQNQAVLEARLKQLEEKELELVSQAKQVAEFSKALQTREAAIQRTVDQRVGESLRLRAKVLDEREEKLKKDEASLNKLKEHLTRTIMNESGEPDVTASVEPKPFLQKIKSEFSRLHRENQKLKTRLATIADYETLKNQKADYEREIKTLRGQVAALQRHLQDERQEHTAMVRELTEKVVQPDRNMELLRREAEKARDQLQLDGLRWESERSRLRAVVKDRGREIDRLKDRLAQQQERFETVSAKLVRMQELSTQATWMMTHSPGTVAPVPQIRLRPPVAPVDPLSGDESSSSLSSITDAKKRIKALEQEASSMQAHFSQYRRYVTTQFHSSSPPASRTVPSFEQPQPTSSSNLPPLPGPGNVTPRSEVPRKLLLTQYLIQDSARPYPSAVNGGNVFSGFSGGDLAGHGRSLDVELREAVESARNAKMAEAAVNEPEMDGELEIESKIAADVRELMALAHTDGDTSPEQDAGW